MKKLEVLILVLAVAGLGAGTKPEQAGPGWKDHFIVDKSRLQSSGRNAYFILEPGFTLFLTDGAETLTVTVLEATEVVDGVTTRVVEERETEKGQRGEVSRNFFAIDPATRDVYYFGEDVDIYKNGRVVSHEGAWRAGLDGAKFGLMIPGAPKVGDKFYQEIAPGVAMDRAEVASLDETLDTPAGKFRGCLRIKETSALEAGSSVKVFAPGLGLVKDDAFLLSKVEQRPI